MNIINFDVDANDFFQAHLFDLRPRTTTISKYFILCIAVIFGAYFFYHESLFFVLSFVIVLTLFLLLWVYVVIPYRERRQIGSSKFSGFQFIFQYDNQGFDIETSTGAAYLRWDELWEWRSNKDYLLIYASPFLYHVIPRRLQDIGADIKKIETNLVANLGKST